MSLTLDTGEVRALAGRIVGNAGRISAQGSALLRKTSFDIQADAMALAPVDTGALRSSISTSFSGDGRGGAMSAEIGPTAEYGVHQEFGTSMQPGTPFMGPAFDRRVPAFNQGLAQLAVQVI